jgi:hypothetical protein
MKIQYADLADIVKMMNRKTGGLLQDPVNEAQQWVDLPVLTTSRQPETSRPESNAQRRT